MDSLIKAHILQQLVGSSGTSESEIRAARERKAADAKRIATRKYTPIMVAVKARWSIERVQAAIDANPDLLDARDRKSRTAIFMAANNGCIDMVMALYRAGAKLHDSSWKGGVGVLHMLASAGATETLRAILGDFDAATALAHLNTLTHNGDDVMHYALSKEGWDHPSVLAAALRVGYDVNTTNDDGWTLLMRTARRGQTATALELLRAGADVNAAKADGWCALMLAVVNDHVEVARALRAAGANPLQGKTHKPTVSAMSQSRRRATREDAKTTARIINKILTG